MQRQRHPWDPVILTTLPHIVCAAIAPYPYSILLGASAVVNLAWHIEHEPTTSLFWIDYGLGLTCSFYDIVYLGHIGLTLNFIAIGTNILANHLATLGIYPYERGHALWHLLTCMLTVCKIDILYRHNEVSPPDVYNSYK